MGLLECGGVSQSFSPSDILRNLSQGPGAPWNGSPGISSVTVPVQQQQEQICVLDEELVLALSAPLSLIIMLSRDKEEIKIAVSHLLL